MERESRSIEYKESVSKSYLKTVSAYANYNDGVIVFGITDDLKTVGIQNAKDECLNIENQINDCIKPKPDFSLKINSNNTISLFVKKGFNTPYRYNGKAFIRNDSSTVEVDDLLEKRLILEGLNINYEELPCNKKDLTFDFLSSKLIEKLNLSSFNLDVLKSLNLYNDKNGYNNAAYLLADNNNYLGVDMVVFGNNINEFKKRYTFNNISILKQYYEALEAFESEYVIEKVDGGFRKKVELIPVEAFREALANSIIHRMWDIRANIKIEMHPDKVKISSPGGLVYSMSKEDFLAGNYSYLRNPIISEVFYRLSIVEKFATGIKRINKNYENNVVKPSFLITSGSISIELPLLKEISLTINERKLFDAMNNNYKYTRSELESISEIYRDTLIRTLNSLIEKKLVVKEGKGKATHYIKS